MDLGLPAGPNPSKELLQKVKAAIALGDVEAYSKLHAEVVQYQQSGREFLSPATLATHEVDEWLCTLVCTVLATPAT